MPLPFAQRVGWAPRGRSFHRTIRASGARPRPNPACVPDRPPVGGLADPNARAVLRRLRRLAQPIAPLSLALAVAGHLEQASRAITNAAPAVGPLASLHLQRLQLQRVVLGPVSIEYADLFVAAVLGAVLAVDSRNRGLASLLGAGAATSLGAFFLVSNVLPATVPAAVALGLEELRSHGRIGQMSPLRLHGRPLGG